MTKAKTKVQKKIKNQIVTKLYNLHCDKSKIQNVTKLKHSKYDKDRIVRKNSNTETYKFINLNCDKT